MAMDDNGILGEIERFLAETGMGPTWFGVRAVGNAHLVGRLRRGRDIETATARKIRAFMDEYRAKPSKEAAE